MTVGQFIDRLEQQGLLDKSVIDELRRKIARAKGKKITPEAIANYLVDGGHLTRFQATQLINETTKRGPGATFDPGESAKAGELRFASDDRAGLREVPRVPAAPGRPAPPSTPPPAPLPQLPPEAEVRPTATADGLLAEPGSFDPLAWLAGERGPSGSDGGRPARPARREAPGSSEWNSKLPLIGGISLGIILMIGAFIYFSLLRRAAETLLETAESAYRDQLYSEAMPLYDEFIDSYPHHERISLARVRRAMAYLLQSSKDPEQGMSVAREILPQIEEEESFPEAHEELANVLPQIAAGFVSQALLAQDTVRQETLLQKTEAAMALVDDPKYMPAIFRKSQATTIESITEDMARVRRKIGRVMSLNATIETINAAVAAGNTPLAYDARQELLGKYLGFDTDEQLLAAMLKVSAKQREQAKVVEQPLNAVTDDPATNLLPHIVLSHRAGSAIANLVGRVVYTLAGGCVFALDASTGDVLWRRFVGFETIVHPQPLAAATPGSDAIAVDQRRNELLRLEAKTGKVLWRLALAEQFFEPVIVGDRLYVAGVSGKLYVVDAVSGQAPRHVQLPQPLEVATCRSIRQPLLYQITEQDNVYVLSADTLECREVFYLGHKRGTVNVRPVMVLGYLFVVENAGPGFSFLHIIATDEQGLKLRSAQEKIRLEGQVLVPPVVAQRTILVVTDRGAAHLCEVDPNNTSGTPILTSASLDATAEAPIISYPLLQGDRAWIANDRLTKYQTQATSGKLPAEWVLDEQDVYVAPLQIVGDVIIHVRQRRNAPGVTIAATRTSDKDPSWQTEVAVPAQGVFVQGDTIDVVTARGRLFRVTAPDFERQVLVQAKATAMRDERQVLSLTEAIGCGDGQWVFSSLPGYNRLVFYRPGSTEDVLRLLTLTVPLGAATAAPVPMAGGLLVPLQDGSVILADPVSGGERMYAFHPSVPVGTPTQWSRPAVLDGGQEFVISNNHRAIYYVGIKDKVGKELAALGETPLEGDVVGPWVAVGNICWGVLRSGMEDAAVAYALPKVTAAQKWPLAGRLLWGPQRAGDVILLATEKELICLDGALAQRWKTLLDHGPVIGQPLCVDTHIWLSAEDGFLWQIDMATGNITATLEVGEPLASGPLAYSNRLLVASQSGVLFDVGIPSPGNGPHKSPHAGDALSER